jgi:hypothetical protein
MMCLKPVPDESRERIFMFLAFVGLNHILLVPVYSQNWSPWLPCDKAIWSRNKATVSSLPGVILKHLYSNQLMQHFPLENLIWSKSLIVHVLSDWVPWNWRWNQASASIYVFLWAGTFLGPDCHSVSLFYLVNRRRSWVSFWRKWYCFALLQRVQPWDKLYQYLLFAAEPYEIIAFKVITQLILVQMDFFWASPVQEELGAKGLVQSAFFHMWTNTDMYRVQEAITTTLYATLSMPRHSYCFYRDKLKWNEAYPDKFIAAWMRILLALTRALDF